MSKVGCEYCSGQNDRPGWRGSYSDDGYIGYTSCWNCNKGGKVKYSEPTQSHPKVKTPKQDEQFKKWFEASFLDGDDVNDCGKAMLSAIDVYETIATHIKQEVDRGRVEELKLLDTRSFMSTGKDAVYEVWQSDIDARIATLTKSIGESHE